MKTNEELKAYFTMDLAEQAADGIVLLMDEVATDDNLEVEFRLHQGKMVGSLNTPNTLFKADTQAGTLLRDVKQAIADVVNRDFDPKIPEEADRMYEAVQIIDDFKENVRIILNSGIFNRRVANTIRRVAMGNVPYQLVPIENIRFLEIEIGEANPDDCIVSIQKFQKIDQTTGQYIDPPQAINQDLFQRQRETGKSFEEIIEERKAAKDPRYECVAGVTRKRYSFEVHCRIAADYSFCEPPEHVKPQKPTT